MEDARDTKLLRALCKLNEATVNHQELDPWDVDQAAKAAKHRETELLPHEQVRVMLGTSPASQILLMPSGEILVLQRAPEKGKTSDLIFKYRPTFTGIHHQAERLFELGNVYGKMYLPTEDQFACAYYDLDHVFHLYWHGRFNLPLPEQDEIGVIQEQICFWLDYEGRPSFSVIGRQENGQSIIKIYRYDEDTNSLVLNDELGPCQGTRVVCIHDGYPCILLSWVANDEEKHTNSLYYRSHMSPRTNIFQITKDKILFHGSTYTTVIRGLGENTDGLFLLHGNTLDLLHNKQTSADLVCGSYQDEETKLFYWLDTSEGPGRNRIRSGYGDAWKSDQIEDDEIEKLFVFKNKCIVAYSSSDDDDPDRIYLITPDGKVEFHFALQYSMIKKLGDRLLILGTRKRNARSGQLVMWLRIDDDKISCRKAVDSHRFQINDFRLSPEGKHLLALRHGHHQFSVFRWLRAEFG